MYMNTTSLQIKIEPDVKVQAQETADELGLSLSAIVKALLKQSDEDIKAGSVTCLKVGRDALSYLDREIENEGKTKKRFVIYPKYIYRDSHSNL